MYVCTPSSSGLRWLVGLLLVRKKHGLESGRHRRTNDITYFLLPPSYLYNADICVFLAEVVICNYEVRWLHDDITLHVGCNPDIFVKVAVVCGYIDNKDLSTQ